jgi:dipeptidyl aminopeptidase/acylaminoacyl peptidase
MPGVNRLIELGIADPDRLAVMGQSYGSYSVLALVTQTTRFKAAVITAVVESDILAGYLYMNNDGTDGTGYFEEGQGGMGGTPWQYRDRYIENSRCGGSTRSRRRS